MTMQTYSKEAIDRLTTEHETYERLLTECREALVYVVSLDGGGPKDMSPSKWVGGFLMYLDEEMPCQVEITTDDTCAP